MRLFMDVHGVDFDQAWDATRRTFAYTNHTLLPEALESWPVALFDRLLPRHMQIIYAINAQVLLEARSTGRFSAEQISGTSLIQEGNERRVRSNLARRFPLINGVSALHTELMKDTVFADLHRLYPDRINNKTNGITPRRWLIQCNPGLTGLAREAIGDKFLDDVSELKKLDKYAEDAAFRENFAAVKRANKVRLANFVSGRLGVKLDPSALFDIRSSTSTNTSASSSTSSGGGALRPDPLASERTDAAREILRRQGGAELPQCEADRGSPTA